MIKLNNKNITYVALADTNNSLKAPKEIWYADSSNSVKLVYRRKDTLIEGEDYEKYHWLKGDGSSYIELDNQFNTDKDAFISAKFKQYSSRNDGYDIVIGKNRSMDGYCIRVSFSTVIFYDLHKVVNGVANSFRKVKSIDTEEHNVYMSFSNLIVDNVDTSIVWGEQFDASMNIKNTRIYSGYAKYKELSIRTNNKEFNLTPCKLLKPVPKWLDANGIRRNIGECGMIDLVSGKFYGNVNSVGTFTVENYYERKEWLIGDGSAYITLDVNIYRETISAVLYPLPAGGSEKYAWMYSYSVANAEIRAYVDKHDRFTIRQGLRVNNTPPQLCYSQLDGEFDITIKRDTDTNTIFVVNGDTRNVAVPCDDRFDITSKISLICDGTRVKTFETDNYNLIPCTLTMDLPASMDANNIARTKGTSGMWDLVSDRFYGNVANSGTFKAVNLAEGVDYEVHQWLKTEVAVEARRMMQLPIHSYSFSFSRKIISGTNVPYFYTEGGAPANVYLNTTNLHTITIWNNVQDTYYKSGQSFDRNDAISIVSSTDGLVVNSQTIPQNTFPAQAIYFGANDDNGTENYTSSITVDGIERYIPVKLLKSIPSKYDANGIARQAGECGMYDTVNDKFYGNVASSGSFSVSDDE